MGGGTEEIVQSFSERTQTRLSAMRELTDCRVGASDGRSFDLHKSLLVMQSTVLREMMADVAAADDIPLSEGGDTLELLVEGMYNANMTISEDNIDACLELARKYDIADMRDNCARFLDCVPLTVHNLPRWLALAEAYDVGTAAQQCQTFVAAGNNFEAMLRIHGVLWYKELPAAQITQMLTTQIRTLKAACGVYRDCLQVAASTAITPTSLRFGNAPLGPKYRQDPTSLEGYNHLDVGTVRRVIYLVKTKGDAKGDAVKQYMPH